VTNPESVEQRLISFVEECKGLKTSSNHCLKEKKKLKREEKKKQMSLKQGLEKNMAETYFQDMNSKVHARY
jgi:hypothetical protein